MQTIENGNETDLNTAEKGGAPVAPPRRDRTTLVVWFTFCLALVLLVAFNMR